MSIHKIHLKFLPKYQILVGLNVYMHETIDMSTEEAYDGVDIELGLLLFVFSVSLLKKRKGAN